jgi:hypothetical protein
LTQSDFSNKGKKKNKKGCMGDCKNCENSSSDSNDDHHDCGGGLSSAQVSNYAGDVSYLKPKF